ncbi:MAG: hypothetical protein K2X38_03310 [Gemmataceae bacterium]|nr:hypothetical protein [Gemmataceae bacterium]
MLIGLPALEKTDWSRLHHAYGRADDTPGHLLALLREDTDSRDKAMSHLWSAIIHQGTPWTATEPAALVVAGLLSDERIDRGESLRAPLLSFLVSVAEASEQAGFEIDELERMAAFNIDPLIDTNDDEALYGNEDAANSFYARSILGCIRVAPVLLQVMLKGMEDAAPRVRACAAMGAVRLAKSDALRGSAPEIETRLISLARNASNTDERSAHVLALGELGNSPIEFLGDASPAVRMCAALAPNLATNPTAISELLNTLQHHAGQIDEWFGEKPPQFPMRPRFPVVSRLVQQVKDFDQMVDAAVSVVQATSKFCVDFDWGPLLASAFPNGKITAMTASQRRFLKALLKNSELWDSTFGNAYKWFTKASLPYDRIACAKLIGES